MLLHSVLGEERVYCDQLRRSTRVGQSAKNLYHLPYPFLEIIFLTEK